MDSTQVQVSKIYAKALLEIALDAKTLSETEEELLGVSEAIESDPMIWTFLGSPKINKVDKEKVIEKAFSGKVDSNTLSFLKLLVKRDRFTYIKEIANQFQLGHDIIKGRIRANVVSAQRLDEKDVKNIRDALSEKYKGDCIIENTVSPDLLGGMVIHFQDKIIDSSFKSRLTQIKRKLLENKKQSWSAYYEN